MNTTVGTCGNCGGPVQVPAAWYATIPPTCAHCGATAKTDHGPMLPMNEPKRKAPGVGELWCATKRQAG